MASLQLVSLLLVLLGCSAFASFNLEDLENPTDDLSETGDLCQDCTEIVKLIDDLLSNADFQKKVINDVDHLCDLLPPSVAKACKDEVEKILPLVMNVISQFLQPDEICKIIGLCGSTGENLLSPHLKEALKAVRRLEKVHATGQCTICIFLIKTLEDMLPKERTESALIELVQKICVILPEAYRNECETIIGKFGKTVLDEILHYASPRALCSLMHMCMTQEEPPLDLCMLKTYSCRDVKTALKCGTVFYCQKFVWTTRSYNSFKKTTWAYKV
ncbi:prosaposin [Thalassophryne amazonica]|uniref:prosaposin n=1 Tax=Thalassophryne amazonica TaxID=390379 RepID=UPI0014710E61|nr:prosaposin [Thalassophryne amazonica]